MTTLANCRIELSKQLDDYWASTTTSAGSTGKNTLKDTLLKAKQDDWITNETYDLITHSGDSSVDEERRVDNLNSIDGTVTLVTAHAAQIGSSKGYELHRLFTASEKGEGLIFAARAGYPSIHEKVWDESIVSGNWLKDGSFEIWSSSSALSHWTDNTTIDQITTALYFKHGATSCKIDTSAGYVRQGISNWDDLKKLAGKSVTFTVQGHCDKASCLRLSIYDGTTTTYSDYHPATSDWTDAPLKVIATIANTPTEITFSILHDVAAGTSYVDDARVIGPSSPRLFIENLGLAQERPARILVEPSYYATSEPWTLIHNAVVDTEDGYLYLPSSVTQDRRLRIKGMGYLDFLASGSSSTTWAATINLSSPQVDILVAEAALYLYTKRSMSNLTSGDSDDFKEMVGFWTLKLRERKAKFGMPIPSIPTKWR